MLQIHFLECAISHSNKPVMCCKFQYMVGLGAFIFQKLQVYLVNIYC